MKPRPVADLSALPPFTFGVRSPMWWGTLAYVATEGMGFAVAAGAYLYLRFANPQWPLSVPPPNHWPGSAVLVLLLVSLWPNALVDAAARNKDLLRVRRLLIILTLIGALAIAIRFFEFSQLHVRWDTNAYGSIIWLILGLHALHLITDLADTIVLTVLMFTRHGRGKRFSDVSDNAFYWYFVVATWIPLYLLVYWLPRM
jgi:cytochrome c oxidase subunit 3